jgi:hypothetical protein
MATSPLKHLRNGDFVSHERERRILVVLCLRDNLTMRSTRLAT